MDRITEEEFREFQLLGPIHLTCNQVNLMIQALSQSCPHPTVHLFIEQLNNILRTTGLASSRRRSLDWLLGEALDYADSEIRRLQNELAKQADVINELSDRLSRY